MTTLLDEKLYTPEDLLGMPDGDRYELMHGHLVERIVGIESNWIATKVAALIGNFLDDHPMGYVLCSEAGFACFPFDPRHLRKPDASFIRFGRLPGEQLPKGYCPIAPDLAVEVVSPNDSAEELETKIAEYQSVGVPLVWVFYPASRRVIVHRSGDSPAGPISRLTEADTISGEDVLPGFTCPVAKFFALPRPQPYSSAKPL